MNSEANRDSVATRLQESGGKGSAWDRPATWLLVGIILLGVALRLYRLGSWPFEQDELYTLHDAVAVGEYINPLRPLYYLLQYGVLEVLPATHLSLRLLPFLFGIAGIWLTWALGRRAFGTVAGLVSAFLIAISFWHLHMSQFARYYTLVYALAALLYIVLPAAVDSDRRRDYLLALITFLLGGLTHPSFAFPAVGVVLAVIFVSRDGRLRWSWPSRRAWLYLWGPLCLLAAGGLAFLLLRGVVSGMRGSRGLDATLRLLPALVQWASPVVVAAGALGMAMLWLGPRGGDRRWAAIAIFGCVSGVGLLLIMSFSRSVYADYGMAMLPLVIVTVGGTIQRLSERLVMGRRTFAVGATLTLAAGMLPSTVSHLLGGTRFDYRPAYEYIVRHGPEHPVVGWPSTIQREYAPDLQFELLRGDVRSLEETLTRTGGFWLVGSYRRRGMLRDSGGVSAWVDRHCHRVLQTEPPRLDYRAYRVELHWCGSSPFPTGAHSGSRGEGP